ncbi:hypothetical protein VP01_1625g4 [Puccinia sorghi]|uniref:Uncharacterized protein n=1 Tax=Puccinia sorghi TaxID=27349 RepID=A0A0L6VIS4_9BASI|nr:hypothetical protein VP01_1625g4 [Puccinia sorghi]
MSLLCYSGAHDITKCCDTCIGAVSARFICSPATIYTAGVDQDKVDMTDTHAPHILEEIQQDRVLFECFEGNIFLHQVRSLVILNLNHSRRSVLSATPLSTISRSLSSALLSFLIKFSP